MLRLSATQLFMRYCILLLLTAIQAHKLAMIFGFAKKTYTHSDSIAFVFAAALIIFLLYLWKRITAIHRYGLVEFKKEKIIVRFGFKETELNRNETTIQKSTNGQKIVLSGPKKVVIPLRAINKKDLCKIDDLLGENIEKSDTIDERDIIETVLKDNLRFTPYYLLYFGVVSFLLVQYFGAIERGANLPYLVSLPVIGIPFLIYFVHAVYRADYHRTLFKEDGDSASSLAVIFAFVLPLIVLQLTVVFIKYLGKVYG